MIPEGFVRVSRLEPCPICGRGDWCLRASDGSDRVLCCRIESPIRWNCGWLHGSQVRKPGPRILAVELQPDFEVLEKLARSCQTNLHERSEIRGALAMRLGVTVEALDALGVGLWEENVSTWPMSDDKKRIIGFQRRYEPNGRKRAVRGSRIGLFIPNVEEQRLVLLPEGGSDTATAVTLGFFAIGRPCCSGGVALLVRWLRPRAHRDLVILADADLPGIQGAASLATTIVAYARSVRVVVGPGGFKDLREAVLNGYTRADMLQDIERAFRVPTSAVVARHRKSSASLVKLIELELTRRLP